MILPLSLRVAPTTISWWFVSYVQGRLQTNCHFNSPRSSTSVLGRYRQSSSVIKPSSVNGTGGFDEVEDVVVVVVVINEVASVVVVVDDVVETVVVDDVAATADEDDEDDGAVALDCTSRRRKLVISSLRCRVSRSSRKSTVSAPAVGSSNGESSDTSFALTAS